MQRKNQSFRRRRYLLKDTLSASAAIARTSSQNPRRLPAALATRTSSYSVRVFRTTPSARAATHHTTSPAHPIAHAPIVTATSVPIIRNTE
jgi:hypothetical protein